MKQKLTHESISILRKLNERKSTGKNDIKCLLYQARHANNGIKIPAKNLMEALGGNFPKAYNSRVNKVYDWKNRKYQKDNGTFTKTSHEEYLKGGVKSPSLSSEYKEILAYEHRIYGYASAYLEFNQLPDGIKNSKQLVERYILNLEGARSQNIIDAIELGREIKTKSNNSTGKLLDIDQIINLIEHNMRIVVSKGTSTQRKRLKEIAFCFIDENTD